MIPAMTPMTIPAIAPPERPLFEGEGVMGKVVPLAVAAGRKVWVVVTDVSDVAVETPPLVPLTGGEYELAVPVGIYVLEYAVHELANAQRWLFAQQIVPQELSPKLVVQKAGAAVVPVATTTGVVATW